MPFQPRASIHDPIHGLRDLRAVVIASARPQSGGRSGTTPIRSRSAGTAPEVRWHGTQPHHRQPLDFDVVGHAELGAAHLAHDPDVLRPGPIVRRGRPSVLPSDGGSPGCGGWRCPATAQESLPGASGWPVAPAERREDDRHRAPALPCRTGCRRRSATARPGSRSRGPCQTPHQLERHIRRERDRDLREGAAEQRAQSGVLEPRGLVERQAIGPG